MHSPFLKRYLPILAICICFDYSVSAQNESGIIEPDTLSAAVVSTSGNVRTDLFTSPVVSIQKEEMEKLGLHEMYEVVNSFAGASVKDYGGIGGVKTVSIRSLGAQHTSVSYDGITISNLQSGQIDISRFSLDNIEQISLTIGQSDEIFQSARAMTSAGNLEIHTAKPVFYDKNYKASISLQASSFKTYSPAIVFQQKIGKNWSLGINAEYLSSESNYPYQIVNGATIEEHIRHNSDIETIKGEFNLYGKIGEGDINIKTNLLSSERGLPGSIVLYNEDSKERLWDKNIFQQISYETPIGNKWDLKTHLKYSYDWNRYYDQSAQYAQGYEDDNYTQQEYYCSIIAGYKPSNTLLFTIAEDIFYNTLASNIPECVFPKRLTSITAISGQYHSDKLTLTASVLGQYTTESVKIGESSPDKNKITPSAGFSFKMFDELNLRLRGSYKRLYRIPTFNDLYYSRVGNTSLKPERADQYNLGLTYSYKNERRESSIFIDNISATVDGYYNIIEDKIVAIPTMFIWRMMNVDKVDIKGVDFTTSTKFVAGTSLNIDFNLNYTFQKALDISNPESKSYKNQIPYAPVNSGSAQLIFNTPWINIGYSINAVGKRYSMTQNVERNLIKGYMDHSISLYKKVNLLGTETILQAEVLNLTDKTYEVIKYYPMPGRSYRLTLKIKL